MREKNEIKISFSTFFLILAIIVIIVMAYFIYKFYNEKTLEAKKVSDLNSQINSLESTVNNLQGKINSISNTINDDASIKTSNNLTETNANNEKTEQIIKFLTSGKIISPEASVGVGNPEMYYFTTNGIFAYMNAPYFTKEGQTISSIGTWEIKDNNIIFTIQQEKKVKGGNMVEAVASDPYDHLENYTEEVSNSTYTEKYEIIDFIKDENKTYNTYYLKLDKMELFQLNLENNETEELKDLATKGSYDI